MASQVVNGKAFEYALLFEFYEHLKIKTNVSIKKNAPYETVKGCFKKFNEDEQNTFRRTAKAAVNFLIDLEPRLSNGLENKDILEIEIASDAAGKLGDVRDVIFIRSLQEWEIGISGKNNHRALKHSRLSLRNWNFGEKWFGFSCSQNYFEDIRPVFEMLNKVRAKDKSTKWTSLENKHQKVYIPILNAFRKELLRQEKENPVIFAKNIMRYLIGKKDFYKVIKTRTKVEIQAYNLNGTLNKPFKKEKAKIKIPKLKLPSRLIEIIYKDNSTTTLLASFNEGWQISFRIHSAGTVVASSLKFDVNLVSTPHSLFTNHKFIT